MKQLAKKLLTRFGVARLSASLLLFLLLAIRVWDPLIVEVVRLKTFDFYQTFSPRSYQKLPVAIVDIDEKSLAELGQWPWPRSTLATILQNIAKAGGVAVAFDVVFAEPDRLSPDQFSGSLPGLSAEAVRELSTLPNTDEIFANTIRQMRVVLGQAGRTDLTEVTRSEQSQTPVALLGPDPTAMMFNYPKLLRNIDVLEKAATGKGLFSIVSDWDGIVRRPALVAVANGKIQPALSIELLRVATGKNAFAVKSDEAGIKGVVVGGVEIPTDRNGRIWVHYSPSMPQRFISASAIANGTADLTSIKGHLLLFGASATGLLDLKATPLDPAMPGVEVHAQILENALSQTFLTRPNYALGAELVVTSLLALVVIYFVPILGALPVLLLGFVLAASWASSSWYMFTSEKLLLDAIYPLFASLSVFSLLVFINYRREEIQRQEIRAAFGQYLAPDYVEQIAMNPDCLSLGGENRRMTILFSDVRDFTRISESFKNNPQGLTRLMNRFLTPLSNAIIQQRGTIDKYMGDAIMAFWNAPLLDDRHEYRACAAALAMLREIQNVNLERQREAEAESKDHVPLRVGIGINTGDCVVGNMGSEFRFDYSVLSDAVNLASRLEGQTKNYGTTIIIGEETARKVADQFAIFEIDLIRVKGKQEPERIFCLYGDADAASTTEFRQRKAQFETLLREYRLGDWEEVCEIGQELIRSGDSQFAGLAATFLDRAVDFRAKPPSNWNGIFTAETK